MPITDKEKHKIYQQKYKGKPGIKEKYRELNKQWIARNRAQYNKAKSEYRFRLKYSAISHYSNGSMCCAHCGYSENIDALCLDHINNNGAEHRKELGCSSRGCAGTTIYERLKAKGWMDGLQVLCFNCNTIKELERKRDGIASKELIAAMTEKISWIGKKEHLPPPSR